MGTHIVKQGEHISRIAHEHGFESFDLLWQRPENQQLKTLRRSPNVLAPGDEVFIPEKEERTETRPTEQRHRFRTKRTPLKLRLKLIGFDGKPIASTPCTFEIEGESKERSTDTAGMIESPLAAADEAGRLTIRQPRQGADVQVSLMIGHLDPVSMASGQQGRLNNLGYFAGEIGAEVNQELLKSAVEEFQCDVGLKVDGVCGENTQKKLTESHGS